MKQIIKHILEVPAESLKRNFASNYLNALQDELKAGEDMEQFTSILNRFQDEMNSIEKHGFTGLFYDGMTNMLLDDTDFQDVEKFYQGKPAEEELEIVVVYPNGRKAVITKDSINL